MDIAVMSKEQLEQLIVDSVTKTVALLTPQLNNEPVETMDIDQLVSFLNGRGLKIPKSAIYKRTHNGTIPFRKLGSTLVFFRKDILVWLDTVLIDPVQEKNKQMQILAASARKKQRHTTKR